MPRKPKPSLIDAENREWSAEDFERARPASEVLPKLIGRQAADELLRRRPGQRGPQKAPTKVATSLRLDRDVLDHFKATGPGWQSRINDTLRQSLRRGRVATARRSPVRKAAR